MIMPNCQAAQYEGCGPGANRLGPSIRDASCFVCWAIARTFNATELEPYVSQLTEALITVSHDHLKSSLLFSPSALFNISVSCSHQLVISFLGRIV